MGRSQFAQLIRYYAALEGIFALEWFIRSLNLKPDEAIYFESMMQAGMPYFREDAFDQRVLSNLKRPPVNPQNPHSQDYLLGQAERVRSKRNAQDAVLSLGGIMQNLLAAFVKTKEVQQFEFLDQYTEFRHLQIVSSMHALVEKFYMEKNIVAVAALRQAVASILKTEHFGVVRLLPRNYFVRTAATSPL